MKHLFIILTHIKTGILLLLFVVSYTICIGQQQYNLVPNYSFEQYTNCPYFNDNSQNDEPSIWYKPDRKGARYFNSCAGNNNTGVPVNFFGGGIIFNMQEQETVML